MSRQPKTKLFFLPMAVFILVLAVGILGISIARGVKKDAVQEGIDASVVIDNPSGEFTYSEADNLPQGFPGDFPFYESAKVENAWSTKGDSTEGMSVVLKSSAESKEVYEFYKTSLIEKQWEITDEFDKDEAYTITFTKNGINGFLGIAREGEETVISVTVGVLE